MNEETKDSSRRITALFYALVLAGGVTLYLTWGIIFGSWNLFVVEHIALYSLVIVMVGMGAIGLVLYGGKHEIK
jgi:hypothetical protein